VTVYTKRRKKQVFVIVPAKTVLKKCAEFENGFQIILTLGEHYDKMKMIFELRGGRLIWRKKHSIKPDK